jgi:hypothetical protein
MYVCMYVRIMYLYVNNVLVVFFYCFGISLLNKTNCGKIWPMAPKTIEV